MASQPPNRRTGPERTAEAGDRGSLVTLHDWDLIRETPGGQQPILRGIDLTLRRGEWLALLGANGSGKTSLLRYLATTDALGAASSFFVTQDPDEQLVCTTVADELALGRPDCQVSATLGEFGLTELADLDPRLLSAGQKQRLQVAIALAADPDVLLCDEPTALQDAEQAAWLLAHLERWRRQTGGTVVTATQDRAELASADRAVILGGGRLLRSGPADQVAADPLAVALLGRSPGAEPTAVDETEPAERRTAAPAERPAQPVTESVARWDSLACRFAGTGGGFAAVELTLAAGDRVGITGPNGCGKSTLLAMAAGLRPPEQGRIFLGNQMVYRAGRPDLDHGLALLAPQFPEYAFTRSSVAAEVMLDPALAVHGTAGVLAAAGLAADLDDRNPHELSSGQRRRLALALVLLSGRPLLLLDEPTVALDRAGRRAVRQLIAATPATSAVVIASHDVALLRSCGCRVLRLTPDGLVPDRR